jgi:antitoxin (DNA-binding transcriptional repressor) of toxin-antitoxin stability system
VRTVGVEVLQNELSEYVRVASQGERVLIVDGGRVVAELVPPEPPGRAERGADAVLAGLVREALVTPALTPGRPLRVEHSRGAKLTELVAEVDADRDDERSLPVSARR